MKNYTVPEEHAEFEQQNLRRHRRPSLVALAVILSLAMSGIGFLHATGVYQFPGTQLFSISAQYSFGAPGQSASTFTAGSTATVTLTVQDLATGPNQLQIAYNATNFGQWNAYDVNDGCSSGSNGVCSRDLSMADPAGIVFAPTNTNLSCSAVRCYSTVQAVHGTNSYIYTLSATTTAQLQSFSLSWTATAV